MSDSDRNRALAVEYLVPRKHSFWRWGDGGNTLEWADAKTIAFRAEIEAVIKALAPEGLPPFGSIVLLLAATRDGFLDPPSRLGQLIGYANQVILPYPGTVAGVLPHRFDAEVKRVSLGLTVVAQLPLEVRQSTPAKIVLAQTVFEASERLLTATAATYVLELLGSSTICHSLATSATDAGLRQFAAELDALNIGLLTVDEERLKLRARTGLEQLPGPAPLKLPSKLPPAKRVQRLIQRLQSDPELSGVARLAQKLVAAIHMPRSLAATEELPVGGVSDLSNRGSFDRLLVSELAHDDLMLAVRVAMNEALYLRRESPPRRPPPSRAILVDCGIRLWGVPRLFATAVGLALAATADPSGELALYRASADCAVPVDLGSRDGLVAHLAGLIPDPHPGRAIQSLVATSKDAQDIEMIIVTHADVLADPEFAAQAGASALGEWYAATVDRDGSFALYLCGTGGRRRVCEARLSLDDLLAPPGHGAQSVPLLKKDIDPSLPVILAMDPFPLRLPYILEATSARASVKYGLFGITPDRRLLRWESDIRGAAQLTANLPRGRFYDLFIDDAAGLLHAVFHFKKFNRLYILTVDLESGEITRFDLNMNIPQTIHYHANVLFVVFLRQVQAVSLSTGMASAPLRLPNNTAWCGGRFFFDLKYVHALAFDGSQVLLQQVGLGGSGSTFDREGVDGPWVMRTNGDFAAADGSETICPRKPFEFERYFFEGASSDGHRVVASIAGENYQINLRSSQSQWTRASTDWRADLLGKQFEWSSRSAIKPFEGLDAIFIDEEGDLRIFTRRSHESHRFLLNEQGDLILANMGLLQASHRVISSGRPRRFPGFGFTLRLFRWADGSRALLDGRGLLHLKSSDRSVPELSLALSTSVVAGWTSEGQTFGWSYFLSDPPTTTSAYAMEVIRQFSARLR